MPFDPNSLNRTSARPFDISSPFAGVTLISPDGDTFPLWIDLSASEEAKSRVFLDPAQELDSLLCVADVTVELQLAFIPRITVNLEFGMEDGTKFLNSRLAEWAYSKIEVQLGYAGLNGTELVTVPFQGMLLKPEVSYSPTVKIGLTGQGIGGYSATMTNGTAPLKGTRQEIIEKLLAGVDKAARRRVTADFSEIRQNPTSLAFKKMFKEPITINQVGKSQWTTIYDIVRQSDSYMVLRGESLEIFPSERWANPPSRHFFSKNYPNGTLDLRKGMYPIKSFSSPTSAVYLPSHLYGYAATDINSAFPKELSTVVVGELTKAGTIESGPQSATGEGTQVAKSTAETAQVDLKTKEGLGFFTGDLTNPKTRADMLKRYKSGYSKLGIYINVDTIGIPDLYPGEVCSINGIGGFRFEQVNYGINRVIHQVGTSVGFITQFEAISNVQAPLQDGTDKKLLTKGKKAPLTLDIDVGFNFDTVYKPKPKKGFL